MGVERTIRFTGGSSPSWETILDHLGRLGEQPVVRMIDGLPAFPGEIPPPDAREVRLSWSIGMVTLHRSEQVIRCVTWGGENPALQQLLENCCRTVAQAGDGTLDGAG